MFSRRKRKTPKISCSCGAHLMAQGRRKGAAAVAQVEVGQLLLSRREMFSSAWGSACCRRRTRWFVCCHFRGASPRSLFRRRFPQRCQNIHVIDLRQDSSNCRKRCQVDPGGYGWSRRRARPRGRSLRLARFYLFLSPSFTPAAAHTQTRDNVRVLHTSQHPCRGRDRLQLEATPPASHRGISPARLSFSRHGTISKRGTLRRDASASHSVRRRALRALSLIACENRAI